MLILNNKHSIFFLIKSFNDNINVLNNKKIHMLQETK